MITNRAIGTGILPVLVLICMVLACAWPTPTPAQVKPIELAFATHGTPGGTFTRYFTEVWVKEVEKRTQGRVKITVYWKEALGKGVDHYDMVRKGVCDVAWGIPGWTPGRFPMTEVMELPFLFNSPISGSRAAWEIYETYLKPEYTGVRVLGVFVSDLNHLWSAKKPIHTLEDLNGTKVRVSGLVPTKTIGLIGGTPVFLAWPDVYEALQRGTVEGAVAGASPMIAFRIYEVGKYGTVLNFNCPMNFLVMNLDTWNKLPQEIQKIPELSGPYVSELGGSAYHKETVRGFEDLSRHGVNIYTLPPAEMERWKKAAVPIYDWWVKNLEAKGLPGKKLLDDAQRLSKKYAQ